MASSIQSFAAPVAATATRTGRGANTALWVLQALLAAAFMAHGLMFLMPPPDIAVLMNESLPRWFQLFLGVAEVAASVGLVLPRLTGVQAWLTAWAAAGVMAVMVSATVWHVVRAEYSSAAITAVLLVMATVVFRGRRRG